MTPPLETNAGLVEQLRAIEMIKVAISSMAASKTGLGYNEMDMKSLARIVFGNWRHVATRIELLTAELEQERSISLSHSSSRKLWEAAAKENMERARAAEAEIERLTKELDDLEEESRDLEEIEVLALAAEARLATIEAKTRADERERCARIAEDGGFIEAPLEGELWIANRIATAIRTEAIGSSENRNK